MIIEENGMFMVAPDPEHKHDWRYSENRLERWCRKCGWRQLCVALGPAEWLDVTSIGDVASKQP